MTPSGELCDIHDRCDRCLFSLEVGEGSIDGEESHARAKIYIIHGPLRHRLMKTIGIHRGEWCAALADRLGLIHVSKVIKHRHAPEDEHILPQLLYTWWMLDYCSMRVQRLVFGINKLLRCCYCGSCSWWGLDATDRVRCIACLLHDDDALTRSPPKGIARSLESHPLFTGRWEVGDQCHSHWQSH